MAKKLISCILVLVMVTMLAVSCSDPVDQSDGQDDDTTPVAADTSDVTAGDITETPASNDLDENGYVKDDIPDDLSLNNETITFLYWEDASNIEFFAEDQNGEGINDALYYRNMTVEDRLDVEFIFVPSLGQYQQQDIFLSKAENDITSGLCEYDVMASYSMTIASAAYMGYAQDLTQFDILDFDKPWWPDNLLNESTIYDKLYFASGDISTNLLYMMYCCFFNKKMLEDNGLASPYDMVDNNEWTLDKMIEMSANIYQDNGDNVVGPEDVFAFNVDSSVHLDPFYYGAGLKTMEKDSDGVPVVSSDLTSEKAANLVAKVRSYLLEGNYANITTKKIFLEGRALFQFERVQMASSDLQNVEFDFGIVPAPKYDSAQENYSTVLSFPYTLYCISSGSQNSESAAVVLECMASEGYRQVTPVLFEVCMKYKYASDDKTSQMYDILRKTTSFDIGRIFTMDFNKITYQHFRKCVDGTSNTEYLTSIKSQIKILERLVTKFAENFEAMN